MRYTHFAVAAIVSFLLSLPMAAHGQLNGANALGDFGLLAGSQPTPGFYLGGFYANYDTRSVRDRDGEEITFDPGADPGRLSVNVFSPFAWWVPGIEVLGANYSVMVVLPFANSRLQLPVLGVDLDTSWGLGDLYVQPVNLGWHTPRADFMAGGGIFFPTGRYGDEDKGDVGSGMWSYELFAGSTLYLDAERRWHVAAMMFWETHSKKEDSEQKVGDLLTIEGGLGASVMSGALSFGAAYYAQWKLTDDEFGVSLPLEIGKHRVYGVGPEVTIPIATSSRFWGQVKLRYLWDFGARTTTSGQRFWATLSLPVPPVRLDN